MKNTGVALAIEKAGGAMRLAEILKVSHQVVYNWEKRGWVPPKRAIYISKKYGIPRADLVNPQWVKLING